jgi:hypothetical protein
MRGVGTKPGAPGNDALHDLSGLCTRHQGDLPLKRPLHGATAPTAMTAAAATALAATSVTATCPTPAPAAALLRRRNLSTYINIIIK